MVKLTDEDIRWIQKRASSRDFSVKNASEIHGLTERRIPQQTKITSTRRGDIGYRTIRFIRTSEKLAEQRLITGNRRKGSGADTKGNIQEVLAMRQRKNSRTQQGFLCFPRYETAPKSSLLKSDKGKDLTKNI
jgi:hypothetical protein